LKKLFLSFALLLSCIFAISLFTVSAESVNLFDPENVVGSLTGGYVSYEDSTLEDGEYYLKIVYDDEDFTTNALTVGYSNVESYEYIEEQYETNGFAFVSGAGVLSETYVFSSHLDSSPYYIAIHFWLGDGQFVIGTDPLEVGDFDFTDSIDYWVLDEFPESDPIFNYSELQLEIPYYDLLTVEEIQGMLTATDSLNGDLTDEITIYADTYSDFEVGDPFLTENIFIFTSLTTAYSSSLDPEIISTANIFYDGTLIFEGGVDAFVFEYGGWDFTNGDFYIDIADGFGSMYINYDGDPILYISNGFVSDVVEDVVFEFPSISPYYITFAVEDFAENTSYLTVECLIFDDLLPIITVDFPAYFVDDTVSYLFDEYGYCAILLTIPYSYYIATNGADILSEAIFDSILITDVYGFYDIYSDLRYSATLTGTANYQYMPLDFGSDNAYSFYVEDLFDSSGNFFAFEINFGFIDDVAPIFEAESPDKIVVGNTTDFDIEDLTALLVVSDETDNVEDLVITVLSDEYTGNETDLGRYEVIFQVEDLSGNTATHTVVVWVFDLLPPMWAVDDEFITVSLNDPITEEDLTIVLESLGILVEDLAFEIEILDGEEYFTSSEIGVYTLSLKIVYENETEQLIDLTLNVVAEDLSLPPSIYDLISPERLNLVLGITSMTALLFVVVMLITRKKRKFIR